MESAKEGSPGNQIVYVYGRKTLANSLVAYGIEREGLARALVADEVRSLQGDDHRPEGGRAPLVLVDVQYVSHEDLLGSLQSAGLGNAVRYQYALFNIQPGTPCDQEALLRGVRGFFYQHDSLELFFKGIRAILDGEIWVSRGSLLNWVLQAKPRKPDPPLEKTLLTRREVEILALVSSGARNEEIADKLFISPHTVKTHLYNIFKKIDVPNRLQAALWASKNL